MEINLIIKFLNTTIKIIINKLHMNPIALHSTKSTNPSIKQSCFPDCAQTLLDATPLIGQIHPFSKIAVIYEPII